MFASSVYKKVKIITTAYDKNKKEEMYMKMYENVYQAKMEIST